MVKFLGIVFGTERMAFHLLDDKLSELKFAIGRASEARVEGATFFIGQTEFCLPDYGHGASFLSGVVYGWAMYVYGRAILFD